MRRLRLVRCVMHLEVVVDDGEVLAPYNVEPFALDESQLRSWDLDVALKGLHDQLGLSPGPDEEA